MTIRCPRYEQLQLHVQQALSKLGELTSAQLNAFKLHDDLSFKKFEKQLELCLGEKERAIGALREHTAEHKCTDF
jgi:hypothetical protein